MDSRAGGAPEAEEALADFGAISKNPTRAGGCSTTARRIRLRAKRIALMAQAWGAVPRDRPSQERPVSTP
jgi:hypothetical protein